MNPKKNLGKLLLTALLTLCGGISFAQENKTPDTTKINTDNSGVNVRDRSARAVTADTQGSDVTSKQDVELTRRIREQLVKDDKLSIYAENIKIITVNGVATLRGPVHSSDERAKVEMHAQKIVGKNKVHNELEVVKKQ